jgi:polyhydroxybutyrate depolymerase
VLIINGTEDPLVPYEGGDVSFLSIKRGKVISVEDTVKFWVTHDGCPAAPQMEQLPHLNPNDSTSTTVERYTGCRDGTEVVLYKVNGGGHTWPGGVQYMSEKFIGKTSRDFSATETIWQFFKLHPMKQ